MGLLEYLGRVFSSGSEEKETRVVVYCQQCNRDLTDLGALIFDERTFCFNQGQRQVQRVYCHEEYMLKQASTYGHPGGNIYFINSEGLQKKLNLGKKFICSRVKEVESIEI